jgi:hypothetical protein
VARAAIARSSAPDVPEGIALVAMLLRLAGLAVLLFGAGFWYLVELHEAGRLDRFRLGHFLLLAATYSLFFAVFAVLGSREVPAWLAVTIAGAVSYPLLMLHVATIVDLRFAVVAALPLAVLTTGIVVNGVYGGSAQSYVYLAMLCAVIAHLTLTNPRFARGQEARRTDLEHELAAAAGELAPQAAATRTAIADARALLALQDPVENETLREWIERRADAAKSVLDAHERLVELHETMRSAGTRAERRAARVGGLQLAGRLARQLPQAAIALREAAAALAEQRRGRQGHVIRMAQSGHCIACGHACSADARYCAACGTRWSETKTCRRCDDVLRLPLHLLDAGSAAAPVTHCFKCGERHAG